MKLCTYSRDGDRRIGFLVDERVCDLRDAAAELGVALPDAADLGELADRSLLPALAELQAAAGPAAATAAWSSAVADVTLHAPYRPQQNVLCAGGNTRDAHFAERVRGGRPWLNYFTKAPTAVNDPGSPISWPRGIASQVYAEPQLAVVVGATTSFVDPDEALDHVFGYAVCTSVSAADLKRKHSQWDKAVSLDSFFCWGPALVTADEVELASLDCNLWLNDRIAVTGAPESGLLTSAEILSEISYGMTLEAGDVLLTGVPESIGHGEQPERWLQDGDVVRSAIDGIGEISNPVQTY